MNTQITSFLKKYPVDILKVNRLLVSAYVSINNIVVEHNTLIRNLLITDESIEEFNALNKFQNILFDVYGEEVSIEKLIELFEFVISPAEKEVNGAVYTPIGIRQYITKGVLHNFEVARWSELQIADISCGCGGFFISLVDYIRSQINIEYSELYRNFFGVDIEQYSIDRTKILLSLYAIQNGEDIQEFNFNLYRANSLAFDWNTIGVFRQNNGFDIVIGNPPYVGSSKIADSSKKLLDNWIVTRSGKTDLYIPFFQIAIECINPNGIVGYITVNNFYRSLNGRAFRTYMSENRYDLKMIDFGAEQVFKGRSTYTCICFITRNQRSIKYTKSSSKELDNIKETDYIELAYDDLSDCKGWLLQKPLIGSNIKKIESTGLPLGKCFDIKNGFATLKNDVFVLNIVRENQSYYYTLASDGNIYQIEKEICRDAIKPNILKSETEIVDKTEKLLFPYTNINGKICPMTEKDFHTDYPFAYKYLLNFKDVLSTRDKGKRKYEQWFAFGRSQALNIVGAKLLFPYIANEPHFVLSNQQDLLFYNGYALVSNNLKSLEIIQKILKSKVFWYYIQHTSKPYGSDYFALAKNYIKDFGVIQLTAEQEIHLYKLNNSNEIDDYLISLYDIDIN
ncbi:Eco57I restriction-modification methylase domain-containing protein [Hoylesella buccalis]|uniref:Eco57I restriction-modification methylase domain-containing protein n=1 Tax=Hoylesella buccalis TaxID=28127 RepID=UPI001D05DB70|nr:N-6 DNA methylase [Hoylesella buccalis]MCB6902980.1 N-6 DNA methylase [Hoylesella buccalis]